MEKYKSTILIIEDEEYNRNFYRQILAEQGYRVEMASNLSEGKVGCQKIQPELVLLDLKFDRDESREGLEFLKNIRHDYPEMEIVVISGSQRDSTKIEAILKYGAYDYLEKPIRRDVLILVVNRVMERIRLKRENERLKRNLATARRFEGFHGIIGQSRAMKSVFEKIEKVAPLESTVLITGETGTGKEMVARAIHELSARSPFVAVDLGAIATELAGSELFGHQRGAFTGAISDRIGKIEQAGEGSLFLDEIENSSMNVQQKLLRVLEQRNYQRLGSNFFLTTRARFLIATNVDLKARVTSGLFRQDLYHRLNVINIHIPPLRERIEDIVLLANYFLDIHSLSLDVYKQLDSHAIEILKLHSWPGNVRELKNAIEEALIFGLDEKYVLAEDFKFLKSGESTQSSFLTETTDLKKFTTLKEAESEAKKSIIIKALDQANGVIAKAARLLDITPRHLKRLMDEFSITPL